LCKSHRYIPSWGLCTPSEGVRPLVFILPVTLKGGSLYSRQRISIHNTYVHIKNPTSKMNWRLVFVFDKNDECKLLKKKKITRSKLYRYFVSAVVMPFQITVEIYFWTTNINKVESVYDYLVYFRTMLVIYIFIFNTLKN